MDRNWWNTYLRRIKPGPELWTTNSEMARVYKLHHIRGEMGGGVATWPDSIRMGGNSGFQALQLALFWGAERVILLGYDMHIAAGRTHWHGDHVKGMSNPLEASVRGWVKCFNDIPPHIRTRVVNASRMTALKCFRRAKLEACISESEA